MPKVLRDAAIIARVHLLAIQREFFAYIVVLGLFPLGILFFARYLVPEGVPVGARLIAGSVVFSLGLTTVNNLSQIMVNERFNNHLKLIIVAPVHRLSYAIGVIAFSSVQGVTGALLVLLFAPLFGIHIELSPWLIPVGLLCALSMTGVGLLIGTWAPSAQAGNLLANTVGILVVMLSPIYFDLSRLPAWLQWPARLSPYTHAGAAMNSILSGAGDFQGEVGILAGITAVTLVLGIAGMRWRDV